MAVRASAAAIAAVHADGAEAARSYRGVGGDDVGAVELHVVELRCADQHAHTGVLTNMH